MTAHSFSLIPFPAPTLPAVAITGTVSLLENLLDLHYSLTGATRQVFLPLPSPSPGRRDELWKATCFEFFLAVKDRPDYWEFNMSPSGDWNVYRMEAYRRLGFRQETGISHLPSVLNKDMDEYALDVSLDLTPILRPGLELQIGITAVIQTHDGNQTYWALIHPGAQADFHLRESFILSLAAETHPAGESALDG
jgi:hypothetical protein